MERSTYGAHTDTSVGIVMKEAVRRAIASVRSNLVHFEIEAKKGYDGGEDLLTTADRAAQEVYLKVIGESFPAIGMVGEEDELTRPGAGQWKEIFFTFDPVDGTKAFTRRQSHGIGTMIALVRDGIVIAAYVGDIMTQEIYGFRPNSQKVHRISEFDVAERLMVDPNRELADRYLLLQEAPHTYEARAQDLIESERLFRGVEVSGGSIGVTMARLWKQEIGAVLLRPSATTLWDSCPVRGISERMGFVFLEANFELTPVDFRPTISERVRTEGMKATFVVHESRVEELRAAWRA